MANEVKATLNMIYTRQADPRTYIEQHFPAIRNAAIALDAAGFSYSQMAAILKISKKAKVNSKNGQPYSGINNP